MAKISPCFKKIFIFFNAIFAIFGIGIFGLGLFAHHYAQEVNAVYVVFFLYVIGGIIFSLSALGSYGAYKESKCALIVFFILMCLATIGTLRVAIPLAMAQQQFIEVFSQTIRTEIKLNKETEKTFGPIQEEFHCCGLFNGYSDWSGQVPASCDCLERSNPSDKCERINSYTGFRDSEDRWVWAKPCAPMFLTYLSKILTIVIGVFFGLAALAILGGLMTLAMIIRVSAPELAQMPSLPLTYQPPKYTEVVNY